MSGVFFKSLGTICLLMAAIIVTEYVNVVLMRDELSQYVVGTTVRCGSLLLFLVTIGIGFFYDRKWAAVLGSIFFTYVGIRLFYDATALVGGRTMLIVSLALAFLLPLIGTIKFWKYLKSGGRWYF
jgi:hypothetical protein